MWNEYIISARICEIPKLCEKKCSRNIEGITFVSSKSKSIFSHNIWIFLTLKTSGLDYTVFVKFLEAHQFYEAIPRTADTIGGCDWGHIHNLTIRFIPTYLFWKCKTRKVWVIMQFSTKIKKIFKNT